MVYFSFGLTHLCRADSSTFNLRTGPFPVYRAYGLFLLVPCFIEIPVFHVNNADPNQTPRSVTSDLGLHCLLMSHLWDAWLKWVNVQYKLVQ